MKPPRTLGELVAWAETSRIPLDAPLLVYDYAEGNDTWAKVNIQRSSPADGIVIEIDDAPRGPTKTLRVGKDE
jgi:hypothetical protein